MKKRMTPRTARYVKFGNILFKNMNSGNTLIGNFEVPLFSKCGGYRNFCFFPSRKKRSIPFHLSFLLVVMHEILIKNCLLLFPLGLW